MTVIEPDRPRRARHAATLAILLVWPHAIPAQELVGLLKRGEEPEAAPLGYARISMCPEGGHGGCHTTTSGAEGAFRLDGLDQGRHLVKVEHDDQVFEQYVVVQGTRTEVRLVVPR